MLQFEEITLNQKKEYEAGIGKIPISYYRFANAFMSRECTFLKFLRLQDALVVACVRDGKVLRVQYPLGAKNRKAALDALRKELGKDLVLAPINAEMVKELTAFYGDEVQCRRTPDNDEYIYRTQDLIELKGKAYHSKRNFIHRFQKEYTYRYLPLDQQGLLQCKPVFDAWFAAHPGHKTEFFDEAMAISQLVQAFDALALKAAAIEVNGKIGAVTIGERISPDMVHILIEKADASVPGLYPLINQEFLAHEWQETRFVNREEDMGIEGLRKAKRSYHPAYMQETFAAKFLK